MEERKKKVRVVTMPDTRDLHFRVDYSETILWRHFHQRWRPHQNIY